jgi:hypothetical protein
LRILAPGACSRLVSIEREHRVDEHTGQPAQQRGVVSHTFAPPVRDRQHPLPKRRGRQHVLDQVSARCAHAAAHDALRDTRRGTARTKSAPFAAKSHDLRSVGNIADEPERRQCEAARTKALVTSSVSSQRLVGGEACLSKADCSEPTATCAGFPAQTYIRHTPENTGELLPSGLNAWIGARCCLSGMSVETKNSSGGSEYDCK